MTTLVVGASGILAPAAAELAARGLRVVGVARKGQFPEGVEPLHLDARDEVALAAALQRCEPEVALVYEPAVSVAALSTLRSLTSRLVLVRTTAAADPALGAFVRVAPDTLQLGWAAFRETTRWHAPEEVSEATLEVLADGVGRVLGSVRPWSDRP